MTGGNSSTLDLGDVNQDGVLDAAVGYDSDQFVSLLMGDRPGVMKTPSDRNWLDWIFRSQVGRPYLTAERDGILSALAKNAQVSLNGPEGAISPLSITPTDTTNLTYRLTFPPLLIDGQYRLFVGPTGVGSNLKDFVDLDGSFVNTGNPMNQDGDAFNGELPTGAFPYDAVGTDPGDRFRGGFAVNFSDNGRFISALFQDFDGTTSTGGRAADNATFNTINATVEPARLTSLNTIASGLISSDEMIDKLISNYYLRYLRRPVNPTPSVELIPTRNRIKDGTLSFRGLVAELIASNEYYTNPALGNSNDNTWIAKLYSDVLPGVAPPAYPAGQTRLQVATALVNSDAALYRTLQEYYQSLLGRLTTLPLTALQRSDGGYLETAQLNLLRAAPAAGQLTGDQKLILALVASPEYLRLQGDTNSSWLEAVYEKVLGRGFIDTAGAEFTGKLNELLVGYRPARRVALETILNGLEARQRFYTDYYTQFVGRAPSAAELTQQEAFYQSNGVRINGGNTATTGTTPQTKRLESVIANVMSTNEYFPISGSGSSNSGWLTKVYNDLLGRPVNMNNPSEAAQLTYLNNQTTTAALVVARQKVVLDVLTTVEYRRLLVTKFYQTYLGRTPSTAERDAAVTMMTNGTTQEALLITLLKEPEYFKLQ
jgi:hypothetical protein